MDPIPFTNGEEGQVITVPLSKAVQIAIKHNSSLPRRGSIPRTSGYERRVQSVIHMRDLGLPLSTIARTTGFTRLGVIGILEKYRPDLIDTSE